jgi:hypothetical protein
MKSFRQYLTESEAPCYVVVRNGRVELRKMDVGSPVATFGAGATTAVLQGSTVVVTLKNGKIAIYKVNPSGTSVSGPYIR